jgi:Cof subfamily protein (haloacid dehalogenase superfamily)
MAKIKLVALDVDGTLVRSDLSLSPSVIRAVESLRDAGILVAINTGRSMGELIDLRRSLPWIRYFIVSNGATGLDTEPNETFYENHLPLSIAREIEREARNYRTLTQVYADGTSYFDESLWPHISRFGTEHMHHPSLIAGYTPAQHVGDLLASRTNDIEKLYISFEDLSDLPRLRAYCETFPVDLVVSIQNGLEVNQKGVEKGTGLLALCKYLDSSPEEVAVVGDGEADIAMFRHAGLSIAMENAQQSVKDAATLVAPSNDSDGAVWAIEQVLKAK